VANDLYAIAPAKVRVVFQLDTDPDTGAFDPTGYPVEVDLEDARPDGFAKPGCFSGYKTFHSAAVAANAFAPGETPANADALKALAKQVARDYYGWLLARADARYEGCCPWFHEGCAETIEYEHTLDRISTRVLRGPYLDHLEDLLHQAEGVIGSGSGSGSGSGPAGTVPVWLVTNVCPVFDDEGGSGSGSGGGGGASTGRYIRVGDPAGGNLGGNYPNPTLRRVDGGTF